MSEDALDPAEQRRAVRERYAAAAEDEGDCCASDGCDGDAADKRLELGYSPEDVADGEASLSLGCGNPGAIAALDPGEVVLDLGSGAGFDCFLAARAVGQSGRVIGVDMTPEMVEKARENAAGSEHGNVEFRLGEIEHLPVADRSVDVVISNCVINLSPDKPQVLREAYRVLRPGGRLAVSDVVLTAEVPADLRADPDSVASCIAGASTVGRLEGLLVEAGFVDIDVSPVDDSAAFIREWDEARDLSEFLISAAITGRRPDR